MSKRIRLLVTLGLTMIMLVVSAVPAGAGNATGLRWPSDNPSLTLVNHTTDFWPGVVATVEGVWDNGSAPADDVLTLSLGNVAAHPTSGDVCSSTWVPTESDFGPNIHVCNRDYENTGWVGLSITWFLTATGEIVVAQTLLNDFFLQDEDSIWFGDDARQLAVCQEIGHGFGLDHQNGRNKQTCMNRIFGVTDEDFIAPNQHDFDQLAEIYSSGGGDGNGDGGGGGGGGPCNKPHSPPQCNPHADFGTLTRIVHVIPALAPSS